MYKKKRQNFGIYFDRNIHKMGTQNHHFLKGVYIYPGVQLSGCTFIRVYIYPGVHLSYPAMGCTFIRVYIYPVTVANAIPGPYYTGHLVHLMN